MEACSLLVNLRKGMQSSREQPLVGEELYMTTLITAAKETNQPVEFPANLYSLADLLEKSGKLTFEIAFCSLLFSIRNFFCRCCFLCCISPD